MVLLDPPSSSLPKVYARSGWLIPTEIPPDKLTDALVKIRSNEFAKPLKGREIRSASSYPYNCVGMIFASRRAWIDIDAIYDIFREDGYREINANDVKPGDVVLYKQGSELTHVALVIQVERIGESSNLRVLSKWGSLAEFIHFVDDVIPMLGKPVEYYTDRI